jgi:putative chitinase
MLLKIGSTGEEVKKLQEKLGVDAGSAAGTFGPKTEAAVKAWQKANGLDDDGVVGPATWAKLFPPAPLVIPTSNFKLDKLRGTIPDTVIVQIPETAAKFNITNVLRLAHFLAQCAHESGNWRAVSENLGYSASQLPKMWPSLFNATNAAQYAMKPEMIANRAYGGRMGNGPESSGEGWKFRGRGYIQLTGKSNYTAFDKFVDDDILSFPELVAQKYPLMSAAFFFNVNNLWTICDRGAGDDVVTSVTKRVNGGTHGLADRLDKFKKYYSLLA